MFELERGLQVHLLQSLPQHRHLEENAQLFENLLGWRVYNFSGQPEPVLCHLQCTEHNPTCTQFLLFLIGRSTAAALQKHLLMLYPILYFLCLHYSTSVLKWKNAEATIAVRVDILCLHTLLVSLRIPYHTWQVTYFSQRMKQHVLCTFTW